MATKKASPAQIAARKLFAERARAGTLKKRSAARRQNPADFDSGRRMTNPDPAHKWAKIGKVFTHDGKRYEVVSYSHDGERIGVKLMRGREAIGPTMIFQVNNLMRKKSPLPAGNTFNSGSRMTMGALYKNPITAKGYKVEALNAKTGKWRRIASFEHLVEAKSYAHAVARCNERIAVRVVK